MKLVPDESVVIDELPPPNELATTTNAIAPLHEDSEVEELCTAKLYLDRLAEIVKELKSQWTAAAQANIEKHGEFMLGDVRFYVGAKTEKKCRDVKAAIHAILTVTGGDLDRLVDCLASGCLKPGETGKVLGDQFAEHFETINYTALKSGEPLKRQLLEVNTRFLR